MTTGAIESRIQFDRLFWLGFMAVGMLTLGYFLAAQRTLVAFMIGGIGWLALLPYHTRLAVFLSVSTFSAALILPYFPGRPYFWEFAALLAWSGLIVTVSMRKFSPDFGEIFHRNKWLFLGVAGYCLVLLIIMGTRGFGLRVLGSDLMGGRFYFQQLACAIFPLLFAMCFVDERTLVRLFILQCLLTTTFLVSDFVYAHASAKLGFILNFFEVPGDAANFEYGARMMGIRRFQSLYIFSQGFILLMLVFYRMKDFVGRKGVWLIPLALVILGIGLLSGHRYLAMILTITMLFCSYAQRFWTPGHVTGVLASAILALAFLYSFADRFPLAAQRAISFMPGIEINSQARQDGVGTFMTREMLRDIGWQMIPQYFWLGRGFGMARIDYSYLWDPTYLQMHINQGRFYNGFIGLMVNTGVFGTGFMLLILASGSIIAWRMIQYLRAYGCDDPFLRMCSLVASLWMANVLAFLFFHGDSEYAMKTFALQAGVLIACQRHLNRRLAGEPGDYDEEYAEADA